MRIRPRTIAALLVFCAYTSLAFAAEKPEPILANRNRVAAGTLANGVLTLHLEIRGGAWHPEAEDGPALYVQAFGEEGKPAQIPGPLVRVPEGTNIHVTIANKLKTKATVFGFNARPGDPKASFDLEPGATRELTFPAGAAGTYFYWARTNTERTDIPPVFEDAQLNGAFIVDPAGAVPPDRIFVINQMMPRADVTHPAFEVVTFNGKSYPFTERLEYNLGENIRWHVINPGVGEHPMHLHGAFFQIAALGDSQRATQFAEGERQSVVTQNMFRATTMTIEWKPSHVGRWLFHCHLSAHISTDERIPVMLPNADAQPVPHSQHEEMGMMHDMAGLVLAINVKGSSDVVATPTSPVHKIDLVIEHREGEAAPFACKVRDRNKLVAAADKGMGPPMVVTRGEPVEITVVNDLKRPTTIHWHGIELDSYYDGVMGGGAGDQVTPQIEPGRSFVARFTPNRAGTFIYHTHSADPEQLPGGIYGPLIVLGPGEHYDSTHDKLLVLSTREADFYSKHITLNGTETPAPLVLTHGEKYRLRIVDIAPEMRGDLHIGTKEQPVSWRALAKDGADLPARLAVSGDAFLHIDSGETYDFEFTPENAGEIPFQFQNQLGKAILASKIIVQ